MAIQLVTRFAPLVDEKFSAESKKALITNQDYDFTGAKTVKVYKISTAQMNDYDRDGTGENASRYGVVQNLNATTEEMTLKKDRAFTFTIDKLDREETGDQLEAAAAMERQQREVIIPEVDNYTFGVMAAGAGTKPAAKALTSENIYTEFITASEVMDNAAVPEDGRFIIVTPAVYRLMKKSPDIIMDTTPGDEKMSQGIIALVDGCQVIKVPAARLPENFGFMMVHPSACCAPTKLEDFKVHEDPPGVSGFLCEGRICYDAFVLENKTSGIYYQEVTPNTGA